MSARAEVERFFAGHTVGLAVHDRLTQLLSSLGPVDIRVSRSQVAFRVTRGFAYLWLPDRWLRGAVAPVVLSIGLDRRIDSPRFKEVVTPAPSRWMHHLELTSPDDIDDEVATWLAEAYRWGS